MNFESEQELMEALDGEYGQEAQAAAIQVAEEHGYEFEFEDGGEAPPTIGDATWQAEMNGQMERLENRIGRPLTTREIEGIVHDTMGLSHIPDLVQEFGEPLYERANNGDQETRQDLLTELAEDHERAAAAQSEAAGPAEPTAFEGDE